jgi:glycerophosphoryl diester phosphodiesterase
MRQSRRQFAIGALAAAVAPVGLPLRAQTLRNEGRPTPLVIARGAAAGGPALGRAAYLSAIDQGADFLAGSLVSSKDGVLVVRDDDELSSATDVAAHPEFAERRATRVIDGVTREGWFTEDFTLAELKSLTLVGGPRDKRLAAADRPTVLTFEELIAIARAGCVSQARVIGVQAHLAHPTYFANLDLPLEPKLAQVIHAQGYNSPVAAMLVASEEPRALKVLSQLTTARRVQRIGAGSGPASSGPTGAPSVSWADMLSPEGLASLARQVWAVALPAEAVLDLSNPRAPQATGLTAQAHMAGLMVHAWAGAEDTPFPPTPFKGGDARRLLTGLFAAGADGVCGDLAAPIARARSDALNARHG